MSIFSKITGLFKAKPKQSNTPFYWPEWRDGKPLWKMTNYDAYIREGFNMNALLYACIMYKARAASTVLLKAYTGDAEAPEALPADNELSMLCARPNRHQSWIEFMMQRITYINVSGNNFAFMQPGAGGAPEAVYNLRPDRVYIQPAKVDGKYTVKGYWYVPEGASVYAALDTDAQTQLANDGHVFPILPEDMAHVKLPNPGDPLEGMGYGMSPFGPLARNADVDNRVTEFLNNLFKRGMMPQGMISFKTQIDDLTAGRFLERWREKYGGSENWFEPLMLDNEATYQRLGLNFDEMGFKSIDERNETRMCMPFGVPPILVGARIGLMRSTYSNYEQAQKAFWTDTMLPELKMFEVEDQYFLNRPEQNAFVQNDLSAVAVLQGDIIQQTEAAYKLWAMGTPANLAMSTVGIKMQPIPGGDIGYISAGVFPAGSTPAIQEQAPESVDEDTRKSIIPFSSKKKVVS